MSHPIAAKITGVAGYVPPKVMTNADLEKIVETNDEWIRTRTGIRERHIVENGVATSHMATEAAKAVLAQTKTDPSEPAWCRNVSVRRRRGGSICPQRAPDSLTRSPWARSSLARARTRKF